MIEQLIGKEAFVRVRVVSVNARGEAVCQTVNQEHEAFDGAGFFPGHLMVHQDAITPAPIHYGGRQINRA